MPTDTTPVRGARSALGLVALGLLLLGCALLVIAGAASDGPLDYRAVGQVALWTLGLTSLVAGPLIGLRLRRLRAVPSLSRRLVVVLVASGLTAVTAMAACRGVIPPWTPTAATTDGACPALDRAGLDGVWPAAERSRTRDDIERNSLGVFTYCGWTNATASPDTSRFLALTALAWLYKGDHLGTPVGYAMDEYRDRYDDASRPRTLVGIGEGAFLVDPGDAVTVVARRANVVTVVEIRRNPAGSPADPASAAQDLVRSMVANIRMGSSVTGGQVIIGDCEAPALLATCGRSPCRSGRGWLFTRRHSGCRIQAL
jgi:hypothetical protein